MNYGGLRCIADTSAPHLGGNVREGDPYCYAPSVWDYLIRRFALRSVLDLGCGMGHAAAYFHRAGLHVIAVDGLLANVQHGVFPSVLVDLSTTAVRCRVDLVHCQEVVEHIAESHLPNLLDSLCTGRYILMTHATPGQGGYHHVNEQTADYWIDHLKHVNCEVLVEDTARVRELATHDGALYLQKTGFVLANRGI